LEFTGKYLCCALAQTLHGELVGLEETNMATTAPRGKDSWIKVVDLMTKNPLMVMSMRQIEWAW
jgi:hypothetical protein